MAQDYVLLDDQNENGMIAVNKSVFKAIAEISIDEIDDAFQVPNSRFTKPLSIKIENNRLNIEADVRLKYGSNVEQTCELVQNRIYENILFMTGFKANSVTVNVSGFEN